MSPLKTLFDDYGQAIWLDFVARGFIEKGDLKRLMDDGVRGVTSNPSIFEKAIAQSEEYSPALVKAQTDRDQSVGDLYEGLAIADIQAAADVLRPLYDSTDGGDGFVSLEVSPYLALDTEGTVTEARRLWKAVERPNLMVKVPGTSAGVPAVETLIGDGININVTLLFSQEVYEAVAKAYIKGLENFAAKGGDVARVASVASFFVSRIDVEADKQLDAKIAAANDPAVKAELEQLKGKVAIANAKLAYARYKDLFAGADWDKLNAKGAHPQRLLWASTGVKNKAYPDTLYIDELIGPNTVNTVPPATLDAFSDHGKPRNSLEENVAEAARILERLEKAGISLDAITKGLVDDGVRLFEEAFDKLLGAVATSRVRVLGDRLNKQSFALGELDSKAKDITESWRAEGTLRKLWQRDKGVWTGADEDRWLGWLDISAREMANADAYAAFAAEVKAEGFTDILLLGMGGSSLGPEVLAQTFGRQPGFPRLQIIDSTDPDQIAATEASVDLSKTLFIVSSKSGSTLEPNIFKDYFYERVSKLIGADKAGQRFVAVTDPGSHMEQAAKAQNFRKIFLGDPKIGGRYSILSAFGLVPAAAMGLDVGKMLETILTMARSCGPDAPPAENPGFLLGAALGAAGLAGRDKITIVTPHELAGFGGWAEQLIAESTGKIGRGLIPVDGEPLGAPEVYGSDRLFIQLRLAGHADSRQDADLATLEQAGHPVVRIDLAAKEDIVQEFFHWAFAVAVAGSVIGINPFDQPDVEASKIKTRELTDAYAKDGSLPAETPFYSGEGVELYADPRNVEALKASGANSLSGYLKAHLDRIKAGDYVALLAYIARNEAHAGQLGETRLAIRDAKTVATCLGFGPRFLHSTGQAYKGGPNTGVFLQITSDHAQDLAIPGAPYTFAVVEAAQARGDFGVLAERDRRALRVHLKGGDAGIALVMLGEAIQKVLG